MRHDPASRGVQEGRPDLSAACGKAEDGGWDLPPPWSHAPPPICRLWGVPFSSVLTETPLPGCLSSALWIALDCLAKSGGHCLLTPLDVCVFSPNTPSLAPLSSPFSPSTHEPQSSERLGNLPRSPCWAGHGGRWRVVGGQPHTRSSVVISSQQTGPTGLPFGGFGPNSHGLVKW